jgi:hypothetical protein
VGAVTCEARCQSLHLYADYEKNGVLTVVEAIGTMHQSAHVPGEDLLSGAVILGDDVDVAVRVRWLLDTVNLLGSLIIGS